MAGQNSTQVKRRRPLTPRSAPPEIRELYRVERVRKKRLWTERHLVNLTRKLDWEEFSQVVIAAERLATARIKKDHLKEGRRRARTDPDFMNFLAATLRHDRLRGD